MYFLFADNNVFRSLFAFSCNFEMHYFPYSIAICACFVNFLFKRLFHGTNYLVI